MLKTILPAAVAGLLVLPFAALAGSGAESPKPAGCKCDPCTCNPCKCGECDCVDCQCDPCECGSQEGQS